MEKETLQIPEKRQKKDPIFGSVEYRFDIFFYQRF